MAQGIQHIRLLPAPAAAEIRRTMHPYRCDTVLVQLRRHLARLLHHESGNSWLTKLIGLWIFSSIVVAVLATEPAIRARHLDLLHHLDLLLASLFAIEYLARLWVAPMRPGARRGLIGALHYACSPLALLDMLAFAPTLIGLVSPQLYLLRLIRLLNIARLAQSSTVRSSLGYFNRALARKWTELQIAATYTVVLVLISSTALYLLEARVQPEHFGSIPRALWWSVITVTSVGYGDVVPQTAAGKFVATLTALGGIAVFGIPVGIIAAGFSESVHEDEER